MTASTPGGSTSVGAQPALEFLPLPAPGDTPVRVLTIAGSDSGGGAGIQADLRTFALTGVHGCVALTAATVQNSVGVQGFHDIPPQIVADQITSVVGDIGVSAVKTGMLASAAIIDAIAATLPPLGIGRTGHIPLLVDPVSASMHGDSLLADNAMDSLRQNLFPLATIVTPNLDEVRLITGIEVVDEDSQQDAARALLDLGAQWALVKGGHMRSSDSSDDLLTDGSTQVVLTAQRLDTPHDHGGGDTLGAAITAALGHGLSVPDAVRFGKAWVTRSLRAAYPLGAGHGPVNAMWRLHS